MSAKKVTFKEMRHDGLVDAVAASASFFQRHRIGMIILVAAVVAAAVVFAVSSYRVSSRITAAAEALSAAQSGEDLKVVYENYPETPSAPLALIQAAALFFSEGDYGSARASYLLFREEYPEHILAPFAQVGLASTLEAEGRWNEAIENYNLVIARYPDSAAAPEAAFNRGRALLAAGRDNEARQAFEQLFQRYPGSPYSLLARDEWVALGYSQ